MQYILLKETYILAIDALFAFRALNNMPYCLPKINNVVQVVHNNHLVGASTPLKLSLWQKLRTTAAYVGKLPTVVYP